MNPQKILLIQTAFLGDLVLTLPLLNRMHLQWPDTRIAVLVESGSAGLLKNHPAVSKLITYKKRNSHNKTSTMFQLINQVKSLKCDLAIIPHRSFRSSFIAFLAGIPKRTGFSGTPGAFLYTKRVFRDLDKHETARNLSLLAPFGVDHENIEPLLKIPGQVSHKTDDWLKNNGLSGGNYLTIAPGSVWNTKRWPLEYWQTLSHQLVEDGQRVVVIGGPEDQELGDRIIEGNEERVINAAGETSILESAEIIKKSKLLISGDTAPVHLACAVNTPVLDIFGPTVPEFGFAPTGENDRIIGLDISCRPCTIHGSNKCPLDHFRCMLELKPEIVLSTVNGMLE